MTAEQVICDLQKQITSLQEELSQANLDILDFEKAAQEWKKGYNDMEYKYKIKLKEAEQTIEELAKECLEKREEDDNY